ncbi:pesticidal crystal cry8Ba protein [Perilla frutescens var. hirtella]|nr:pesticidal crystal cry8Ba protein [Perilla frutescens var. hirtella]
MSKQKLHSDSVVGLRYRGNSLGLPSVSRFRSGYMPSGMDVSRVTDNLSESDMDTSDSEGDRYGARYSLEASPQDDKVANGGARHNAFVNSPGKYYDRVGGRGGGLSAAAHRDSAYDDSSESVTSSEVNSTPASSNNGISVEKIHTPGANLPRTGVQPNKQTINQDFHNAREQEKFSDDDIPSAPPLAGSFQHPNQVSEKPPTVRADADPRSATSGASAAKIEPNKYKSTTLSSAEVETSEVSVRNAAVSSHPLPGRYPTFHASGLGNWYAVLSYDACVRLCLHSWARGCMEAPPFLENECALLRDVFGLRKVLLQSEEELLRKDPSELVGEGAFVKTKKTIGKIKVQVRKVKMGMEQPTGCTFTSLKSSSMVKLESFQHRLSNVKSIVSSERRVQRTQNITPVITINGSLLHKSVAHIIVGTCRYLKEVPKLIKIGFNAWRNSASTYEVVQESYSCLLRLKSSPEEDALRMQPGSGEARVFLPDGFGDDLIIEVQDSKGKYCGHALVQVADIADESGEKLRQCLISREPEHEQVGKLQLYINYSTTPDENSYKCTSVAETIAYDCVLETAMKVQQFQQRNLLLHGSWKWLVTEFASYFGVSDAYTKLRYLSYVMDVATPTADCLDLVHDLLLPVVIKGKSKHTLSHQEVRLLGEVSDQIEQILTLAFENYKSLDESLPSGIVDVFAPATGVAAPALAPALKLYKMLHDILSPEVQLKLCRYFQNATRKRSRRHLSETDEFVSSNENILLDPVAVSTAYKKMKTLCLNIRLEILTDIEIHKQDLLPSFIDLPNLSTSIYSTELYSRLREFLVSCPPAGPSPPVAELVVATADFQRDLSLWNISFIKGGVDAKELFHLYITRWIQDKRLSLLESCKLDRAKSSSFSTTPFIDDIYNRLRETLTEYDVIVCRWPEYTFALENAMADVEKAVVESLEKQYAEVLSSLKENTIPKRFGLKYVQKFAKGNTPPYNVSAELGVLLNSMKRMLDSLRPQIESQLKQWGSCMPESGNMVPGEKLSEITVMIRSKFRAYAQAVVDKLVDNTKLHNVTKLKKTIQDAKENVIESDLRQRMQPLKELLTNTINQLHTVLETQVFVMVCRGFWDRMGQDVLKFLEDRKENRSWYKASRVAVNVLDDTFASQMQQLIGNALQEKDLEPPRCIMEVRSMLCKDVTNNKRGNYFY